MAVYYDDLVLAGTRYQPGGFGQTATPGYADDIVYVAPFSVGPVIDIDCTAALLSLEGLAASVAIGVFVNCSAAVLALMGLAATIIVPTLGAISVSVSDGSIGTATASDGIPE